MPLHDDDHASEFAGRPLRRNGTHCHPHTPTASEKLRLLYTTGDETGRANPDDGSAFHGLLPEVEARRHKGEGAF